MYYKIIVTFSDVATGTVVLYRPVTDNCYYPLKEDGKFVPDLHQDTVIFENVHVIKRVTKYEDRHIYRPWPEEPIPYLAFHEVVTHYHILYDYELYFESISAEDDGFGAFWLNYDGYQREILLDYSVYDYSQEFDEYPHDFEGKDGTQCFLPRTYDIS